MNVKIDLTSPFALLGRRVRRRDSRQGWLPMSWMPFGVVEKMGEHAAVHGFEA
jgi:hypothetical protein